MNILLTGVRLTKRGFLVITSLLFSFFSWYYVNSLFVLQHVVGSSVDAYLMAHVSFSFIIVIALLLGSFFVCRFSKIRIICVSSVVTSMGTILLLFTSSIILRLMIIFVEGVFFGISQLVFFTYFWSLTVSEERGRAAGLAGFFALPLANTLGWMADTFDFFGVVMLSVILSLGSLVIILLRPEKKAMLTPKKDENESSPEKRTVLLYLVPWALFSLINATLAKNTTLYVLQTVPFSYYSILVVLQIVSAAFGAFGGGIIADFFGRKLSLVFSLSLYGIGSALIGSVENYEMFGFVYVANGLNWGILMTQYLLVVWGDLAVKESCAKIYSIGLITFYGAVGVGSLFTNQISQIPLIVSSLLTCALIFLSNIPLILAPELLSSDFREKIKLKLYMNVVRKIGRRQSQNQG